MKNYRTFALSILLFLVVLVGCSDKVVDKLGTLQININTSVSRGIQAISMETAYYNVVVKNSSDEIVASIFRDTRTSYSASLPAGTYSISVEALNSTGDVIGTGSCEATVVGGQTNSFNITVSEAEGNGAFSMAIAADSGYTLSYVIKTADGTTVRSGNLEYSEGVYSASETLANGFYTFTITRTDTSKILKHESIRIIKARTLSYEATFLFLPDGSVTIINEIVQTPVIDITLSSSYPGIGDTLTASATISGIASGYTCYWVFDGVAQGEAGVYEDFGYEILDSDEGDHEIALFVIRENTIWSKSKAFTVRSANSKSAKIGFVMINDESDMGYTWNFMNGMNDAIAQLQTEGYDIELLTRKNTTESSMCTTKNIELAEAGCEIIFNNSYGFEPFMKAAAKDYPDVKFVSISNCGSQVDGYANTYNAFAAIYEARYVSGIAAGMKLQQMIDAGQIQQNEAVMGFVGAYSFSEVISSMTAFFLGARSVCPSVTMKVYFVGSWGDSTLERNAAETLVAQGCKLISQFSDTASPASVAQTAGIYHVGYNTDKTGIAPAASLISSRIDWSVYFYQFIKNYIDGIENPSDWCGTFADGAVGVTTLNTDIAAPGTQEAMNQAIAALGAGDLHVFDLSTFTINGETGTNSNMYDSYAAVQGNATYDGYFHESELQSAPYFVGQIDGIEWLNEAY